MQKVDLVGIEPTASGCMANRAANLLGPRSKG